MLAAIDHNSHAFRKPALKKNGNPKYSKVYSKRSKNWKIEVVKEDKTYSYWPTLASRILNKRASDNDSMQRKVKVPVSHPRNIAPSIALKPIQKTIDQVEQKLSRFVNKPETNVSQQETVAEDQINQAPEASQE